MQNAECRMQNERTAKMRELLAEGKNYAEIERLKEAYLTYEETSGLKQAKSEAIKEVFQKIEAKFGITDNDMIVAIDVAELKKLYKEMVGESNE